MCPPSCGSPAPARRRRRSRPAARAGCATRCRSVSFLCSAQRQTGAGLYLPKPLGRALERFVFLRETESQHWRGGRSIQEWRCGNRRHTTFFCESHRELSVVFGRDRREIHQLKVAAAAGQRTESRSLHQLQEEIALSLEERRQLFQPTPGRHKIGKRV